MWDLTNLDLAEKKSASQSIPQGINAAKFANVVKDWFWEAWSCNNNFDFKRATQQQFDEHRRKMSPPRIAVVETRAKVRKNRPNESPLTQASHAATDGLFVRFLESTADPRIMESYWRWYDIGQQLQSESNEGGDRQSYHVRVGRAKAARIAMQETLALRLQEHGDLLSKLDEVKVRAIVNADRYAKESECDELSKKQAGRLMAHANLTAEKDRSEKIARRLEAQNRKRQAAAEKQIVADKKRQAKAAKASGFNTVIAEPYHRNH